MSLVIDRHLAPCDCFDVSSATTLFWKAVPVVLKAADREEIREEFTVRILSGVTKNNHNLRALRIYISADSDYLFLHTLEVTEEEFQGLKAEQGILKCMSSTTGEFEAELTTENAASCLKIVETNDFNKLPRITLKFLPGSDHCVKSFLAFRLTEVDHDYKSLQSELDASQMKCEKLNQELLTREESWGALKEQYERTRLEGRAETKRVHLEAKEKVTEQRESLKSALDKERKESEEKLRTQIDQLMTKTRDLEEENRTLRDDKYALDRKCSELSHRLATAEGHLTSQTKESNDLRETYQRNAEENIKHQTELNQIKADMRVQTEKLCSAESCMKSQISRLEDMEGAKAQLERLCEELRGTIVGHETSVSHKTRDLENAKLVIEKLATDLFKAKERHNKLRAIISCQEDAAAFQSKQLNTTTDEKSSLEQTVHCLRRENQSLQSDLEDARNKLKESADQLKDNEHMIGWLHRQINDSAIYRERQGPMRTYQPGATTHLRRDPSTSPFFSSRRNASDTTDADGITPDTEQV